MKGSKSKKARRNVHLRVLACRWDLRSFYLSFIVLIPLAGVFIKTSGLSWAAVLEYRYECAGRRFLPNELRDGFCSRSCQCCFRPIHCLGAGTIPVSRQETDGQSS